MSIFEIVINALNRTAARYVIVGGFAVNMRGHQRFTSDLDVAIDLAPRSTELLIGALESVGFRPRVGVSAREIADASIRRSWIEEKGAKVIPFLHPEHPTFAVDVFIDPPVNFEELFQKSSEIPLGTFSARVASLEHLIGMKKLAGRPEDLADVAVLERLLKGWQ